MGVVDQKITERYALYHGDCIAVMESWPAESIHTSIYSPPFAGLYQYSSSEHDLSNSRNYQEFAEHYAYVVRALAKLTIPGRITAVHCMDIPTSNTGCDALFDFPGEIIRLHERCGFEFITRRVIWKEPLTVRNRTLRKDLAHRTIVDDSTKATVACADQLLEFRKKGRNPIPVRHDRGLLSYAGERQIPADLLHYRGWTGKQTENRYSHWIWRQYASSFWDDIRLDRVLPFREARDEEDEKHVHPLQLDVIERCVELRSNPGERVFTPFMGVGSEVYGSVRNGRVGIGAELKASYYRQALRNLDALEHETEQEELALFAGSSPEQTA